MKKFIMLMLLMLATLARASADAAPQPYAVLDNGTLTFYFDDQTRSGAMPLNEDDADPAWFQYAFSITTVEFTESFQDARPTTCYNWFYGCTNLTEIKGIQYLNTSEVTNMFSMFDDCESLESLDLSSFNTAKVTNMSYMFDDCASLESLDLSSFNTSEVTKMFSMFSGCSALKSLDLSSFNTAWVRDMARMFSGCSALKSLDLSSFNTARVEDLGEMFRDCKALKSLDLSSFNTVKVTKMNIMFYGCSSLQSLNLSSFNTEKVTDMGSMFKLCSALKFLDISSFNTASVMNLGGMFYGCQALESLDLRSFNTKKVRDMGDMFSNCSALKTILVGSDWNVDNVPSSNNMFNGCKKLTGGNGTTYQADKTDKTYAVIDGKDGNPGYLTSLKQCTPYAELIDNPYGRTLVFRFGYKPNNAMSLKEGDNFPVWDPYAFEITTVEFDPLFKYARPKTCYFWFSGCSNLTEIKGIQYLNTSEVTDMSGMFSYCSALESLDLSSFNTEKVTDMGSMFSDCSALKSLNLSSFNTSGVEEMENMFSDCSALKSLDLSSFNTERVMILVEMFSGCSALKSLDLSSFNTEQVMNLGGMFSYCSALKTILVGSGWNVDKVPASDYMFTGCENLIGGSGTTYQADKTDITYAVIDGKDSKPGYLTLNALTLTKTNGITTAVLNGDFTDGSGAALIIDKEIKVDELTFNRKFTNGVTATVMFPFGFTAGNNIKGTFHTITKVGPDKSGLWTAELSNAITDIKANTPYIFYPTEDITSISFNNITLVPTNGTLTNGDANGWLLHGVYSKKIWTEDSKTEYGFAAVKVEEANIEAGEFVLAGKDAWADPMRCYLTYAGSGKPFTAKAATVLPDRIRVVFPSDNDDEITTDPANVITPVSSVSETEDVKVWSFGGTVYIEAQPDMDYTIIDLSGRTIKKGVTRSTREEVALSRHGAIVIVNINGKSVKVNL